ncbi:MULTISPECIES: AI-2E family transporter [Anaerococcus]|uniref:AI-2 transport protein TqsA n=3 Tax=Anaerococcus TaxID=165779 RepID=A0A6N2RFQ2_9FIRM|nr:MULTISPECIES: AI-2E family transporter [Anaerococcus]EEU13388.1 putative ATP synthase F0, A subunit [Anaerococcus vaginalis ATCC 51170]MDU0944854.1 AI-2E family transporter [Anaerococcus vaginalis]MDU1030094.1 AI-2E family transporter [Anaerococcus vaginalis]MDU2374600.1 AI-2E family transporter [Anaerococcus vaginalis]MDU2648900.1 AI-2E family transporter [Anaerococcus vaginalis]
MKKLDEKNSQLLKVILISILVFFAFWYIENVKNGLTVFIAVIQPFLIGFMLAFIINLPMNFFERKVYSKIFKTEKTKKLVPVFSLISSWILFILGIVIFLNVLIPRISKAVTALIERFPLFLDDLIDLLNKNKLTKNFADDAQKYINSVDWNNVLVQVKDYFVGEAGNIFDKTTSIINSVSSTIITIAAATIFSVFVLINKKDLKILANRIIYSLFKRSTADEINKVASLSYSSFASYINSKALSSLILGILVFVGMLILKIPFAAMAAILVAIADFIPYVGPLIATVIMMILIFIESPFKSLVFLIFLLIAQQVQGSIIYPALAGKTIGLPSIWVIVSIAIGGSLFGIVGMLVSIPIASILYTLMNEKMDKTLAKKEISENEIKELSEKVHYKKEEK